MTLRIDRDIEDIESKILFFEGRRGKITSEREDNPFEQIVDSQIVGLKLEILNLKDLLVGPKLAKIMADNFTEEIDKSRVRIGNDRSNESIGPIRQLPKFKPWRGGEFEH